MKIQIVLTACFILSACSRAPERPRGNKGSSDSSQETELPGGGSSTKIPSLSFTSERLEGLPYKALIDKLAYTAGLSPADALKNDAFKVLIEKRYVLGDYNYAIRNSGSVVWETTDMSNWMDASLPYCQSQLVKTKYKSDPEAFVSALLGRSLLESDKSSIAELKKLSAKADEGFELSCVAFINSLEFRNQWPKANGKLDDYVRFLAGTMLHLPASPSKTPVKKETIETVIGELVESDRLVLSSKAFMDHLMQTSGKADGIDYDLPSNILLAAIRQKEPYGSILYSDTCYDDSGETIECDSGSPNPSGVLSSRAFLKSRYGAYNIFRASALVKRFMCASYPLASTLEPPAAAEELIDKFAATSGEGFGNGSNCLSCHSQFARHTQLFVKFDSEGLYKAEANSIEDKNVASTGGYTKIGTMASHFRDPSVAGLEKSSMLGKPAVNLQEAGKILAESDMFLDCSLRNLLQHFLRLSSEDMDLLKPALVADIRRSIQKESKDSDASLQLILKKALSHPKVIEAFGAGG